MDRRGFLKYGSLAAGSYALLGCRGENESGSRRVGKNVPATESNATLIVSDEQLFTRADPGPWGGLEASHLPKLVAQDGRLVMTTEHPSQTPDHYIARHQLRDEKGLVLADRLINPSSAATSIFLIHEPVADSISALSTCNLHGIWQEVFPVEGLAGGFLPPPVYTAENPGPWAGKENAHLPALKAVSRDATSGSLRLQISTEHPMTAEHFIARHEIRDARGHLIAQNILSPDVDKAAASLIEIQAPQAGLQLFSVCNQHGIWMKPLLYEELVIAYTAAKPNPDGSSPAAHVPVISLVDLSTANRASYAVTLVNNHEMTANTHYIMRHEIRNDQGAVIADRLFNSAVDTLASTGFISTLFQVGSGRFAAYATCNLHGIWKAEFSFEQANVTYEAPGPAGGDAAAHKPVVTLADDKLTISTATAHPMTDAHFIIRHQIRADSGSLIYEKNFPKTGALPVSVFPLAGLAKGNYKAYVFCNLHGIWKSAFTV